MATALRWAALGSLAREVKASAGPGTPPLSARVRALPRLVASVLRGRYRGVSGGRLLCLAAGLMYVVSPVDALPELVLPLVGLVDDALVVAWLAATITRETGSFLDWERTASDVVTSTARPR
jgi:uncharacterized membrane protein YkvA (DUF1232 family)